MPNSKTIVEEYLSGKDWRVKENSNSIFSFGGLNKYLSGEVSKDYWLRSVYPEYISKEYVDGAMHIHDLGGLSIYTYFGKESIIIKDSSGKILLTSFQSLYDSLSEKERCVNSIDDVWQIEVSGYKVLDKDGWVNINKLTRKAKHRNMKFIKNEQGRSVIVTDNHPMLVTDGISDAVSEKESGLIKVNTDYLYSPDIVKLLKNENLFCTNELDLLQLMPDTIGRDIVYANGYPIKEMRDDNSVSVIHLASQQIPRIFKLTKEMGFVVGFAIAEGSFAFEGGSQCGTISIKNKSKYDVDRVVSSMLDAGCPCTVTFDAASDIYTIYIANRLFVYVFRTILGLTGKSVDKNLPENILQFNKDFVDGVISGIIDGDGCGNSTQITIRVASRLMLNQIATLLPFFGLFGRDRRIEGQGTTHYYNGKTLTQNYPIYGLAFRKQEYNLSSSKYNKIDVSKSHWRTEELDCWSKVLNVEDVNIPDDYIYDITTSSSTLLVNGMYNHNCCGYSLQTILMKGVRGVPNIPTSKPAKHFDSVLNQISNLITVFQNEIMGAVALNSFDTLLAPFIKKDCLKYEDIKQSMQNFLFSINSNSRAGSEPAFSNLTFDLTPPEDLLDEYAIIGGELESFTYRKCQQEMDLLNKVFFELMLEGDSEGKLFAYPIPTYNIHSRFDWDNPNNKLLWEMAGKYGTPYFANFLNSDLDVRDIRSMCCRLSLNLNELKKKNGGLFGAGDSTGCYDDKTEILTKENGWIKFKDLTTNHTIFTLSENDKIEEKKPYKIFEYDYNGELIHFNTSRFDLLVTPNHNMLVKTKHDGKKKFVRADEFKQFQHSIPKCGNWVGKNVEYFELPEISNSWKAGEHYGERGYVREPIKIPMDVWVDFLGWFISEGSYDDESYAQSHGYRTVITQRKNTEEVEIVLNKLPFTWVKYGDQYIICNKQLWSYLKQFGHCYDKFIPNEIKELDKKYLQILYNSLMSGDGSINKTTGQHTYYTSSKILADDVQEIIVKLGHMCSIRSRNRKQIHIDGRTHDTQVCYEISSTKSENFYIKDCGIAKENYCGKVYCCEVENHTMLVRRNNKATWCGNSIGVVTINLPRIGYESNTEEEFFSRLDYLMTVAKDSLEIKRDWLQENIINTHAIPAFMEYVGTIDNHFSTIGDIGKNEMCLNFLGKDILSDEGKRFAEKVGDFFRNKLIAFQEETGHLYNYEASPSESTCYRLAKKDKETYPEIITQGEGKDIYYTNSCHIPVKLIESIDKTFSHQDSLQTQYTGGTVIHIYLDGAITGEQAKSVIKNVCYNYRTPYVSLSPISRYCDEHGYVKEIVDKCPICKKRLKKYQRITGYLRCIDNFNKGKAQEFKDRAQLSSTKLGE